MEGVWQRPFGPKVCASSPATRHYWNCWTLLQIKDGMLMCHFGRHDAVGDHIQFIVPRSLHNEVLHHVHDLLLGDHLGQKKTREKALQRFYWSGIRENCNNWVTKCDECAKVNHPPRKPLHLWWRCQLVPLWTDYPQIFWTPSQSLLMIIHVYWLLPTTSPSGWKFLQSWTEVQ